MARRKFDPTMALGAEFPDAASPSTPRGDQPSAPPATGGSTPLSVSQASELIRRTLEDRLPPALSIVGEVSNLSVRKHWYFSLKDEHAVLSCVCWASSAAGMSDPPEDGEQVVARGTIGHYAPQGRTQFYVTAIHRLGAGELERRFRALCAELRSLGYFDDGRKKPLPVFPRRIAVITSRSGAALQDVIATSRVRCPSIELLVVDVRVQGDGAAASIARAIREVDRRRRELRIDAMLVTRGGGSMEDLWPFNERIVADAVMACELPVVAAIGHESDVTVIELVADLRAATPTQAMMRLAPDVREVCRHMEFLQQRLKAVLRRRIEGEMQRLELVSRHEFFRRPHAILRRQRERASLLSWRLRSALAARVADASATIDRLATALGPSEAVAVQRERLSSMDQRLRRAIQGRTALSSATLAGLGARLTSLGPQSVLARGFSITFDAEGRVLRSPAQVRPGEVLHTRLAEGEVASRVVAGAEAPRRPRARRGHDLPQMDLFDAAR